MTLALLLSLVVTQGHPRFERFCSRSEQGRTSRGLPCVNFAFFEAFPNAGTGSTGACSAVAPTGAKGEALTTARASGATCNSNPAGGTATTGIPNATLVELGSNVPLQEYGVPGWLGVRSQASRQNVLVRFIDYANGAWADVGTPTLTGGQTSPFTGTYATSAVQVDDNDGAAFEGRTQTVTVSAGAAYTMHCYVKAGTLDQARISLDGTAVNITGLSATTWSIISVTDASTSGVAVAAQILNGDATGDTGTVIWGGCQVEAGSDYTSIIPTVAAAVTRAAETLSFAGISWPTSASISMAASFIGTTPTSGSAATVLEFTGLASILNESAGNWRWFSGGVAQSVAIASAAAGIRTYGWHDGATRGLAWAANVAGPTADVNAANKFGATLFIGGSAGNRPNGIIYGVVVDPDATRAR